MAPEEAGPERARVVALNEEVDVAHMIRLEHHDERRRGLVEPRPDLARVGRWCERIEQRDLSSRRHARRVHERSEERRVGKERSAQGTPYIRDESTETR